MRSCTEGNEGTVRSLYSEDIAVIGMDCLLPNADGTEEFFDNLKLGRDSVSEFPEKRRRDADNCRAYAGLGRVDYRLGNYLCEIDSFDYRFFHITPREAALMNPNQRILLQLIYRTIQDAGLSEERVRGSDTGLFIGYIGDYDGGAYTSMVYESQEESSPTGSLASMMAGRIAYLLDLRGPAMLIDTACSSSLTAVHQACRAIRSGECSMALAAGVRTVLFPGREHSIGIESEDGYTRVFDENASGTGLGEGAAGILLKSLPEAEKDGDMIYAVIRGSAVNQDGSCIGLTAPNGNAQTRVLRQAWKYAAVRAEEISYIEAHGTGTRLGDPVEIEALNQAFRCDTEEEDFCRIGSVKSNLGHLYDCAGIVGVIKTALMLYHRCYVPSAHFHRLNPEIRLEHSPLRISEEYCAWEPRNGRWIAGVSAFGFSGTNCHLVMEAHREEEGEDEREERRSAPEASHLFPLSAKSREALYELINSYRILSLDLQDRELEALCTSMQLDRTHYDYRLAFRLSDSESLWRMLEEIYDYRLLDEPDYLPEGVCFGKAEEEGKGSPRAEGLTMEELCASYVRFRSFSFESIYYHRRKKRMRLPLYPFEKERCWIRLPKEKLRKSPGREEETGGPGEEMEPIVLRGREEGASYSRMEREIAGIFQREMGFHEFSVHDSFYALGGDSITAYRIVNRINAAHGSRMTMADILQYSTIEKLAAHIEENVGDPEESGALYHIEKAPKQSSYPLSYAQQRMFLLYLRDPEDSSYNMPFSIRFRGCLDIERFRSSFQRIFRLHDIFRSRFYIEDGAARQSVDEEKELSITELRGGEEASLPRLRELMNRPFDLEKDPLLRVALLEISKEEYLSFIVMNHIAADGSSLRILSDEFVKLYQGIPVERQELQYKDFALWQRKLDLSRQEHFWFERMEGYRREELPLDFERRGGERKSEELGFSMDKGSAEKLRGLCREKDLSLFSVLMAAFQLALSQFTASDEVIVGTPISGRTAIETQQMVGMFVNVMPVRGRIEREEKLSEFIRRTHRLLLSVLGNQDYPFELLVEKLKEEREAFRNPVFDTVFAFQNMDRPEFSLPGLSAAMENEDKRAKFDITMEASEEEGELSFLLRYAGTLFLKESMEGFFTLYRDLVQKIAEGSELPIGELLSLISRNGGMDGEITEDAAEFSGLDFDF